MLYLTRLSPQDLQSGPYEAYAKTMVDLLSAHTGPLLYAAGHDHSLQLQRMRGARSWYHLVSGSGSKQSGVGAVQSDDVETIFAASLLGYARLDLRAGRPARLTVFTRCSETDLSQADSSRSGLCRDESDSAARPVYSLEIR